MRCQRLILVLLLTCLKFSTFSQFYFLEDAHEQLSLSFINKKIETLPNQSFFNAIKIVNPSNRKIEFIARFSYPAEWSFIGDKEQRLVINPNDSIIVPFRASASINTKGEIGYAIVASLDDLNGNTFKNEYSFVTIPKKKSYSFKPVSKVQYVDRQTNLSEISLKIANNGNTDEDFFIEFGLGDVFEAAGSVDGQYLGEINLKPFNDTTYNLPVKYLPKKNIDDKAFHPIKIKIVNKDTVQNMVVWMKVLEPKYSNYRISQYNMLEVELINSNIFSDDKSILSFLIKGNVLFKNNSNIYYDMRNYGAMFYDDPWKYGKYVIGYNSKNLDVVLGDVNLMIEQNNYGRGGKFLIKYPKNQFSMLFTNTLSSKRINAGFSYLHKITPQQSVEIGYGKTIDNNYNTDENIAFTGMFLPLKKFGTLSFRIAASTLQFKNIDNNKPIIGYGYRITYGLRHNNTDIRFNSRYGHTNYVGNIKGQAQSQFELRQFFENKNYIKLYWQYNKSKPIFYSDNQIITEKYLLNQDLRLTYNKNINPKLLIEAGPLLSQKKSNSFYAYNSNIEFGTLNPFIYSRILTRYGKSTFSFNIEGGYSFVNKYPQSYIDSIRNNTGGENFEPNDNWFTYKLSSYFKYSIFNFNIQYYNGPYTIPQQFNYFSYGKYNKTINVFPIVDFFVIPSRLQLTAKINYNYEIETKVNRLNFNAEATGYLGYGWQLGFLGTYNYQSNKDEITDELFTYSATYFEFKVKKEFGFKQPRFKYCNLDVIFFKDLNGNSIKDKDEPGIKNVLFSIKQNEEEINKLPFNTTSYFMGTELLSDLNGEVRYENIPNGFYTIEYYPLSEEKSTYSATESIKNIYIDKNEKLYIPFYENNKIFGKIILNRSKLSNLGTIDISNIKVTIEDSHGKKYSTLTDNKGNFVLFVPNIDRYNVHVNNIFFENFELEQNDYEVQLNGYKQFEVNFIFNEKKRKINFASNYEYGSKLDGPGIEIVRRTNMIGIVKDATTLSPIAAKIRIIDKNGNEITSTQTNSKTGQYTTSFIAGDDYAIEVTAPDYWYMAEKLYSQQIVTFKNLEKDILMKGIVVGSIIPMKTLNFDIGKTDIPATAFPELERLLRVLRANPGVKIAVHGHADDMEILSADNDIALGRAEIVAKYLIANGYNRVKYSGHANTKPIAQNDTEDGRKQNRRVEIVVTDK